MRISNQLEGSVCSTIDAIASATYIARLCVGMMTEINGAIEAWCIVVSGAL